MRMTVVRTLLLILLATPAWAAESLFGNAYFGGDARLLDARTEARGGTGFAFRDSLNANVLLPTQLLDLRRVTVSVATSYERRGSEDAAGSITRYGLVTPSFRVGLPLGERMALGVGFSALRATQWEIVRDYEPDPSLEATEVLEREGTRFMIPLQLGVRVHEKVAVGGGLILERGTVRQRYLADLPGSDIDPEETREEITRSIAFELAGSVQDLGPLSFGGYFVPQHDGDVDITRRGVALEAREDGERTDTLPARWGLGLRLDLGERWSLGADVEQERWKDYEGRGFVDENGEVATLDDEFELRVGIERRSVRMATGESRPLRAGFHWRRWNYDLGGDDLTEWGVTVGTAVPFRSTYARADVALGFARIGSLERNGAEETVVRLVFSITGGERWY